nr:PREDICTED: CAAX prenyl protease 1 homolog [Bemisia tabaci]
MMKMEDYIFWGIVSFMWIEYLWDLYLSLRQRNVYLTHLKRPEILEGILDGKDYEKARVYALDKSNFGIIKDGYGLVLNSVIIFCNGLVYFWNSGQSMAGVVGLEENELVVSACFMVLMNIFNVITSLPTSIYNTFVLEEKHGFNKQTVPFFIKDHIKSFGITQVLTIPLTMAVVYIVKIGGDYFFFYLWLFTLVMSLFLMTIYPDYIAPLFDKYTPLPEGELRSSIEELASSIGFPLYKLYVVEGSKRSAHSNAYFYGFFKNKRIVLYDTLLKDYKPVSDKKDDDKNEREEIEAEKKGESKKGCDNDEVLAVLAHELGHWKLNHVLKNIIIMQVNLLLMFLAFGLLFKYSVLYRAFGFFDSQPVFIGLVIVQQFVFSPYNAILSFLLTILCRKFEFQADAFALALGKEEYLQAALIKLNKDNLSFPIYDWLFSMWHLSHPPLLERLEALKKIK